MREDHPVDEKAANFVELVLPRASIADLDAERLVDHIASEHARPRPGLAAIAAAMGVPPQDCLATVMSARATLMAASRGRAFYRHELRGRIPMAPGLVPETEVWDAGTVPQWEDGVYNEPKYFSFRQDAPFAAYNPVHRKKWRPHELLHGAVGFFYRPNMTRFEAYVGSRLNELLPVVHWYELDEIFRPRCERHRGEVLFRDWCERCEEAVRPYWEVDPGDERAVAVQFVKNAQEHFHLEISACRREVATGRVHEAPLGRLNSSSDSVGYLLGHWPRMTAWSFGCWVELFLREGFDYFDELAAYADRVEACASRLVGGAVVVTPSRFQALRQRRTLQDVAYRALLALEWLDREQAVGKAVERTILIALERCSSAVDELVDSDDARHEADDALDGLFDVLEETRDAFPEEVADPLLAMGLDWFDRGRDPEWELRNLAEGISQAAPLTADRLDAGHVETFGRSEQFRQPGRLVTRFASYLREKSDRKPHYEETADLASLEAWAAEDPRRDEEAERFAHPLEEPREAEPGSLRLNRTFRRATFGAAAVREFLELEVEDGPVELAAAYWRGEFHIVLVDATVRATLAAVAAGGNSDGDALLELVEAGVIVWLPAPGRPQTNE